MSYADKEPNKTLIAIAESNITFAENLVTFLKEGNKQKIIEELIDYAFYQLRCADGIAKMAGADLLDRDSFEPAKRKLFEAFGIHFKKGNSGL